VLVCVSWQDRKALADAKLAVLACARAALAAGVGKAARCALLAEDDAKAARAARALLAAEAQAHAADVRAAQQLHDDAARLELAACAAAARRAGDLEAAQEHQRVRAAEAGAAERAAMVRELAAKTDLSPCRGDDANNGAASVVARVAFTTEEEAAAVAAAAEVFVQAEFEGLKLEARLATLEARCATEDIRIARAEARVEAAAQAGLT
jgi:hypothetical protein